MLTSCYGNSWGNWMFGVSQLCKVTSCLEALVRCCTIMGREEGNLTAAQILYPLMQCTEAWRQTQLGPGAWFISAGYPVLGSKWSWWGSAITPNIPREYQMNHWWVTPVFSHWTCCINHQWLIRVVSSSINHDQPMITHRQSSAYHKLTLINLWSLMIDHQFTNHYILIIIHAYLNHH